MIKDACTARTLASAALLLRVKRPAAERACTEGYLASAALLLVEMTRDQGRVYRENPSLRCAAATG